MTAERTGVRSPVVDQARPTQETLSWSEEARGKLQEIVGAAPDFDALVQELQLATVDDDVLQGFEARFQEILRLTEGAIGELTIAVEAAQTAGDFADLLGGDDIEVLQENQRVLRIVSEELTRNKETIHHVLSRRELARTSEEKELQEKERFISGLNRSGFDVHELFAVMEQVAPEKAAQFIREKANEEDPRWSRAVGEVNKQYDLALVQIQQERERLAKKLVRSDQLKQWIVALGLTDELEENPNEAPKPLVVQLRAKNTYEAALSKVRAKNAEELSAFQATEEPRLQELEAQAAQIRDTELKKALFGEPHSREGQYYKMRVEDVTPLLEDGTVPRDAVVQKIAEQILTRRGRYGEKGPTVTPREVAFLPKSILDRLVASMDYEELAFVISKDDKEKPPIFWSESFGEKLTQLRQRHRELSQKQAFEETHPQGFRDRDNGVSLDNLKSLSGNLFAQYQKADTAYFEASNSGDGNFDRSKERLASLERNRVFESEIGGIFEKYRICNTLAGVSRDIRSDDRNRGFTSVGNSLFLNGYDLFQDERGERVSALYGQSAIDDRRNRREFTPQQETDYQKREFLEIQGKIAEFARNFGRELPKETEKQKQENAARTLLAEKARQIETDFAGLDAELAPLKAEAAILAKDVEVTQKKVQEMSQKKLSVEELTALSDENKRIVAAMKEFNTRVTALREKVKAWGFQGYTGDSIQENARGIAWSTGRDVIEQERAIWDRKVTSSLMDERTQPSLGQNFAGSIENQLRQVQEEAQRHAAELDRELARQAELMRRQTAEVERQKQERESNIFTRVSQAERLYRQKNTEALNLEETIRYTEQSIAETGVVLQKINEAFEKNKAVSFGFFTRKQDIYYYDDTEKVVKLSKDATADDYKWRTDDMTKLKVGKEKEVVDARTRIAKFKRDVRVLVDDSSDPYQEAERGLVNIGLDEQAIASKLAEAARLRDILVSTSQRILS